ncbi:MAG: hypothetical protein K2Z81_12390 [Cyanobacteria bacterium]|nr:hypothetical protein [Cyanobacteriota bacterium]
MNAELKIPQFQAVDSNNAEIKATEAARASSQMPAREIAVEIVRQLQSHGHVAVFAGGCVRDEIMGKKPKDFDVATSATPEEIEQIFDRTIPTGKQFGVMTVVIESIPTEVATFRGDGQYVDGRRPESVEFFTSASIESMRLDAERRDLTINAMFKDPLSSELFDFFGGKDDIQRGVIRAVGDAEARIKEDRLRMIRAIRFAAVFGFALEVSLVKAIKKNAARISGARL